MILFHESETVAYFRVCRCSRDARLDETVSGNDEGGWSLHDREAAREVVPIGEINIDMRYTGELAGYRRQLSVHAGAARTERRGELDKRGAIAEGVKTEHRRLHAVGAEHRDHTSVSASQYEPEHSHTRDDRNHRE